jgi:two-component system, OmpR family, copper resistance phosphate regulon response regulator CusR
VPAWILHPGENFANHIKLFMETNTYAYPVISPCELLRAADLVMDPDKGEVRRDSKKLNLEGREYQLLEYFLRNKNRIVSRSELIRDVWKQDVNIHTMDARISALRKKIDGTFPVKLLYTISRKGYQLLDSHNH